MHFIDKNLHKFAVLAVLLFVLVGSVKYLSPKVSSPFTHENQIASIDEKIETVMKLTAGSTTLSAVISMTPDDAGTPIAEKLADLSSYFLLVLCALYLEKYLLTLSGYVVFSWLIPVIALMLGISLFWEKHYLRQICVKLAIFGAILFLAVPVSLKVSDLVFDTYQASIEQTIESAGESVSRLESDAAEAELQDGEEGSKGFFAGLWNQLEGQISSRMKQFEQVVTQYIEALAVLIVTSCIIPVLVLLIMIWLARILIEGTQFGHGFYHGHRVRRKQ